MAEGSRSSAEEQGQAWARWLMPSVADLIFVAALAVLVFTPLSVRLLGDAGIGWHIRTGQQILATHSVPHSDPFSSSTAGQRWFAWEWLYDVIVGELEAHLGLNGVVWFTAIVIATVFAGLFRLLMREGASLVVSVLMTLLALSASMIHFLARPHVVSWLFTLAFFWILDISERNSLGGRVIRNPDLLWSLPLLMLVWVNMHGGFLVGFVLIAIYWLGATWTWIRTRDTGIEQSFARIAAEKRSRSLALVGLISLAASLINPYGWNLHLHIYSYLSDRFLINHIQEFQSPDFHGLAQRCFAVLVLIVLAVLAAGGRRLRVSEALMILFAVYTGLYAARNIPISSILLVSVVAPRIWPSVGARGFLQRMQKVDSGLRGHLWPVLAIVLTFFIAGNPGTAKPLMDAHFDPNRMPVEAVSYLKNRDIKGPALSPDYWGGYLIYRLYPRDQVVVDDRHDLYGPEFFKSYLKMVKVERGWQEFLEQHPASCLILPRDAALANVLFESTNWKAVYQDDVAAVFVPNR